MDTTEMRKLAALSKPYHTCTMGVGCEQMRTCFADLHGRPEYCEAGDGAARRIVRDMEALIDRVWEDTIELSQKDPLPLYLVPTNEAATEARIVAGLPGDSIRVVGSPDYSAIERRILKNARFAHLYSHQGTTTGRRK